MLTLSLIIFFVVTFLVIAIAMVVVFLMMQKRAVQTANASLNEAFDEDQDPASMDRLLKSEELSSISIWHSLLARFDFVDILKKQIAQADLAWSVGRVTMAILLCGAAALFVLVRISWIPLWVAIGSSGFAALAPYFHIMRKRNKRFTRFQEAFPDALDSLSRALKAGYPLIGALELVANESDPPVSTELRKTFVEANLGIPWDRALANLSERIPLAEVNIFVAAVQIHQRTGGRLSDVIARLTDTMREQVALAGEVRAIAAHGRITGLVLTILPIGIAAMLMIVSPAYIGVLFGHPYGKDMIAAAIACIVLAHFVMRKLTDVKI